MPEEYEMYYGFTRFAMELNELDPDMAKYLPITDTRFRPDQRYVNDCLLLFVFDWFISSTWYHFVHNVKHTDFKAYLTKYPSDRRLDGPWSQSVCYGIKKMCCSCWQFNPYSKSSGLFTVGLAFLSTACRMHHMHKHSIWTTGVVGWKLFQIWHGIVCFALPVWMLCYICLHVCNVDYWKKGTCHQQKLWNFSWSKHSGTDVNTKSRMVYNMSHDGLGMFEKNNITYANITMLMSLVKKRPTEINVLYIYHHNIIKDNYCKYPLGMLQLLPAILWGLTPCVKVLKCFMCKIL